MSRARSYCIGSGQQSVWVYTTLFCSTVNLDQGLFCTVFCTRQTVKARGVTCRCCDMQGRSMLASPTVSTIDASDAELQEQFWQLQCSEGYRGPACSLCARNDTVSFGRTGAAKCSPCRSTGLIVLAYLGSALLVVLYECYNIQATLTENIEEVQGSSPSLQTSELLRVLSRPTPTNSCSSALHARALSIPCLYCWPAVSTLCKCQICVTSIGPVVSCLYSLSYSS